MDLVISLITDILKDRIEEADIRQPGARVQGYSTFPRSGNEQDLIYIIEGESLPADNMLPPVCMFVSAEKYRECKSVSNRILLKRGVSGMRIAVELEEIFRRYNKWSDSLKESLLAEEGVKALLQLSIPVFDNPVFFVNLEYRVLALANVPGGIQLSDRYGEELIEGKVFGEQLMEVITDSEEYLDMMTPEKVVRWNEQHWGGEFMASNDLEYTLILNNCNRPYRPGDDYLLTYLMSMVMRSVQRQHMYPAFSIDDLRQIIMNATDPAGKVLAKDVQKLAEGFRWKTDDTFLCAVLYPSPSDLIRKTLLYFCIQLESSIEGTKAIALDSQIVVFFNMTRTGLSRSDISDALTGFLEANKLQGGLSMPAESLFELKAYIQQAKTAFEMGASSGRKETLFMFEDYILEYMIQKSTGHFEAKYLMPQKLKDLFEHDREFRTDYVKVLKAYLENKCNIADTVRELYMHRNTFIYKLKRIKEIMGTDLNDKDERLLLMLLLHLERDEDLVE